jgi:hypothetical protein
MLIRLFFPTAILRQPQPPRWGLGAREVEWLAALHCGVSTVAAAPCRTPPLRPHGSVLHSARTTARSPALRLRPLRPTPLALLRTRRSAAPPASLRPHIPPHAASLPPLRAARPHAALPVLRRGKLLRPRRRARPWGWGRRRGGRSGGREPAAGGEVVDGWGRDNIFFKGEGIRLEPHKIEWERSERDKNCQRRVVVGSSGQHNDGSGVRGWQLGW